MTTPTAQHTLYPFNAEDGSLAGIIAPMTTPFDTLNQWQAFLDTLFSALVTANPHENLDGIYAISFHPTTDPQRDDAHLLITRTSNGNIAESVREIAATDNLESTLGLIAVITEHDRALRTATLALRGGYLPQTKKMRKDRILATLVNADGTISNLNLDQHAKVSMRLLGRLMNRALDESLGRKLAQRPETD